MSSAVNVDNFFTNYVLSDLQPVNESLSSFLKVDAIKFLLNFRNQISPENLRLSLPLLQHHLGSHHVAVYTYAAITLDKLIMLKRNTSDNLLLVDPEMAKAVCVPGLEKIRQILFAKRTAERISENEFLMRGTFID